MKHGQRSKAASDVKYAKDTTSGNDTISLRYVKRLASRRVRRDIKAALRLV